LITKGETIPTASYRGSFARSIRTAAAYSLGEGWRGSVWPEQLSETPNRLAFWRKHPSRLICEL